MKMPYINTALSSLQKLMKKLELLRQRSRTRKQLLNLDEHQLKDIGLTRQQAMKEARLHFWQVRGAGHDENDKRSNLRPGLVTDNKLV